MNDNAGSSTTMFGMNQWTGWFLAVVLLFGPSAAAAQSDGGDDQPQKLSDLSEDERDDFVEFVKAGKEAYQAGDYEKAIPFLRKAYDIFPKPGLKYRMAQAYERTGELEKAKKAYETFLEEKPDTDRKGAVEKKIAELEEKIDEQSRADITIESSPSGAKVFVRPTDADELEESSRGRTPLEFSAKPGDIKVVLEKEGYETQSKMMSLEGGTSSTIAYDLKSVDSGGSGGGIGAGATIGFVIGGIGAVGGGGFYGLGIYCRNSSDGVRRNCTRNLFNISVISSYVGGGLGVIGFGMATVFLVAQSGGGSGSAALEPPPLRVHVSPTGIGISGRF